MKTFTIDAENTITAFASKKEAASASVTPFDSFSSQNELAELTDEWPMSRLVEVWNCIPGVTAVTKLTSRKIAAERIWKAIQNLGETAAQTPVREGQPESTIVIPVALDLVKKGPRVAKTAAVGVAELAADTQENRPNLEQKADTDAQAPAVAPEASAAKRKANRHKKVSEGKRGAESMESAGPRGGSKTAQVVEMLRRENGATMAEIMDRMGWQKHTVRGFMAGAMKKAGYTVESFKPEGGERSYRING